VVSLGLLGAIPFFAWAVLFGLSFVRVLRRPQVTVWQVALAASLMTFFIHGAVDYFLSANSTGLLFWLLSGLWVMVDKETVSVV
jgi:O-antigen ligase